jgi:hypothetical protein
MTTEIDQNPGALRCTQAAPMVMLFTPIELRRSAVGRTSHQAGGGN